MNKITKLAGISMVVGSFHFLISSDQASLSTINLTRSTPVTRKSFTDSKLSLFYIFSKSIKTVSIKNQKQT